MKPPASSDRGQIAFSAIEPNANATALLRFAEAAWNVNDFTTARELCERAQRSARRRVDTEHAAALLDCAKLLELEHPPRRSVEQRAPRSLHQDPLYFQAVAAYIRRQYAEAEHIVRASHAPCAATGARRLLLLADLAAARNDFQKRADQARDAFDMLSGEAPQEDALLEATRSILVDAAREMNRCDLDPTAFGKNAFGVGAVAWRFALAGDHAEAGRIANAGLSVCSDVEHLVHRTDRAMLAILRCGSAALVEPGLGEVVEALAAAIDWSAAPEDAVAILPYVAQVLAEYDKRATAAILCDLAQSLTTQLDPRSTLAHGSRFAASIAEARALIALGEDGKTAAQHGRVAYAWLDRTGFSWRAARMARVLYHVEHALSWRDQMNLHLSKFPNGALPNLLALGNLTQREREVYELDVQGLTTQKIADTLRIAPYTVRNHRKAVEKKLLRRRKRGIASSRIAAE